MARPLAWLDAMSRGACAARLGSRAAMLRGGLGPELTPLRTGWEAPRAAMLHPAAELACTMLSWEEL